jgi:hypothetical protein
MLMTRLKISAAFLAAVCAVTPGQERKRADPKDGTAVKGTLVGVDADKNTITIAVTSFDRKAGESSETNKTFAVGKDATILQDEGKAKLTDLKKGYPTTLKLDQTTAVSVSVDGGTARAEFFSANTERNTITVIAGRNMEKRVYHLLKDTKVTGDDGKPIRVPDLKVGTVLLLTLSVEDDRTAVRVQTQPTPNRPRNR